MFGHVKGAFTGADQDPKGLFEAAADSTRREHADSVVSAAADVLQMPPAAVWPAIAAAFARASEMDASLDGLAAFLARGKGKNRAEAGGKRA